MSAPIVQNQNTVRASNLEPLKFREEIEMKWGLHVMDVNLSEVLSTKTMAKMLGGLALGAILMTATALPFGATYADEPSRPLVSEEISINRGGENTPDDAWIFDSPFYETFLEASSVEVQRTPDDAWIFNAPFYETFLEGSRVKIQDTPDDAWIFNSPFYETFLEDSSVEVKSTPDDAWIFDSPFYELPR